MPPLLLHSLNVELLHPGLHDVVLLLDQVIEHVALVNLIGAVHEPLPHIGGAAHAPDVPEDLVLSFLHLRGQERLKYGNRALGLVLGHSIAIDEPVLSILSLGFHYNLPRASPATACLKL